MRTGAELIITSEKLDLWANAGQINSEHFTQTYKSLLSIGMPQHLNEISVKAMIDLIKNNDHAEIQKALSSLSASGYRCKGELGHRELKVIHNLINNIYYEDQEQQGEIIAEGYPKLIKKLEA